MIARACTLLASPMHEAIHALKYRGERDLAPLLARYLNAGYTQYFANSSPTSMAAIVPPVSAIVPVPLHPLREAQRGYNQSALLARHLAASCGVSLYENALERVRDTPPQVGKNYKERQENVAGSFRAPGQLDGMNLLLIDDVYTTGATLRACAEAALHAGAHSVCALTLARPLLQP